MNKVFMNMTIFCNSKETVTNIGCLTKINPERIYRAKCNEQLNKALTVVSYKVDKADPMYLQHYRTKVKTAQFAGQ
eukprot:15326431-Ditylum_brightwellii.AAC.1